MRTPSRRGPTRRAPHARRVLTTGAAVALAAPFLAAAPLANAAASGSIRPPGSSADVWSNVTIGAGGFVTGVVFNQTQPGLAYLRTDIGGLYRWSGATQTWTPLLDSTTYQNWNELGVDSVATDPVHPNRVWAAVGEYAYSWNDANSSAILSSDDYGKTWHTFTVPFEIGSNDQGRDSGERLAVDPNDDKILFYGTENDGLWQSVNGGATWSKDTAFPDQGSNTAAGLQFVTFDQNEKHRGSATQHIVVGDADTSTLYETDDGGATWHSVAGGPGTVPVKAQFSGDGSMYVVYDQYTGPYWMGTGKLYKFAPGATAEAAVGAAADVSPPPSYNWYGYDGLALDPKHPETVYVATNDRWSPIDTIYRSTDGGATWTDVSASTSLNISYEPYLAWGAQPKFGWWIGTVAVDPFDSNHVVYGTGATLFGTYNMGALTTGGTVDFSASASKGIEETAVQSLLVPNGSSGCKLISAVGDLGGFCHSSLTVSPTETFDASYGTGSGLAQDASGNLIAFVGETGASTAGGQYSTDGGATWTQFTAPSTMSWGQGKVAVSADGGAIVWDPADGSTPVVSTDRGASWTAVSGLPTGLTPVADSADASDFYALDPATGVLYRSTDGGASFTQQASGLYESGDDQIQAVPGKAGDLYFAAETGGLFHSTDGGATWTAVDPTHLSAGFALGFGAAAPGSPDKTLYMVGTLDGTTGFYMSTDAGRAWTRINTNQQNFGWIGTIIGDPKHFGRVYVGTNGRGIQTVDVAARH